MVVSNYVVLESQRINIALGQDHECTLLFYECELFLIILHDSH